jgi:hypothetical protein
VYDRLRVHHHLDALVRDPEEVMRLDHLEALVDERRGIDGDPPPHVPGRMCERLVGSDAPQVRTAPEGAAGRSQDEAISRAGGGACEQLLQRGVLGVDRKDPGAAGLRQSGHEVAADHQALLVGQGDVGALRQGHDRRAEPGDANDRVQDQVRLCGRDQLPDSRLPGEDPGAVELAGRALGRLGVGEGEGLGARLEGLLEQPLPVAGGGQSRHLKGARARDHVQRLLPDRAGGAENQDPRGHVGQCREALYRRRTHLCSHA